MRAVIELIEELALRGGGYGLFTGCAAGDSAMAVVVEVGTGRGRSYLDLSSCCAFRSDPDAFNAWSSRNIPMSIG